MALCYKAPRLIVDGMAIYIIVVALMFNSDIISLDTHITFNQVGSK